ncbi:hypothetical protein Emag_006662 [Eimeria magna]
MKPAQGQEQQLKLLLLPCCRTARCCCCCTAAADAAAAAVLQQLPVLLLLLRCSSRRCCCFYGLLLTLQQTLGRTPAAFSSLKPWEIGVFRAAVSGRQKRRGAQPQHRSVYDGAAAAAAAAAAGAAATAAGPAQTEQQASSSTARSSFASEGPPGAANPAAAAPATAAAAATATTAAADFEHLQRLLVGTLRNIRSLGLGWRLEAQQLHPAYPPCLLLLLRVPAASCAVGSKPGGQGSLGWSRPCSTQEETEQEQPPLAAAAAAAAVAAAAGISKEKNQSVGWKLKRSYTTRGNSPQDKTGLRRRWSSLLPLCMQKASSSGPAPSAPCVASSMLGIRARAENEEEALPGEGLKESSPPRSPGFSGGPNCSSGEGAEEEEQQQQQQQQEEQQLQEDQQQEEQQQQQEEGADASGARSNEDSGGAALGGGPGGRRTQYRVVCPSPKLQSYACKYACSGVLEYCEAASMEAAIRELDGARLRGTEVIIKRDRGDFDALLSSAPPRWVSSRGRLLRGAPRGPPSSSAQWYGGPAADPPDLRMREHQRPGEMSGGGPLRTPDYQSRNGGGPPYPGARGSRLSGRGAPVSLGPPPERYHHGSYGGGGGGPPLPTPRGSRGGGMLVDEELLGPRRMHSPPRSSTRAAAAQGPPTLRAPRRSRSASPSWRGPPVHAGYRGASGKDAFGASRGAAAYEDIPARREGPPPLSSHRDGGPYREGSRREYYRRNGGGPPSYMNGEEEAEMFEDIVGGKPGVYHRGRPLPPAREMERMSPPPHQHAYSRGPPPPSSGGDRAMPALVSGGPSRGAWERAPRREPGSPRRTRGPPTAVGLGGGPSGSRGYEADDRSRSRSLGRRPYDEAKRRRPSSPPGGGMLVSMYGSQPQATVGGGPPNTDAGVEGGPLVGYSRRRPRSRSPRGGREAPPYKAAPHGVHYLSEGGRQQHAYGGGSGGPSGLGVGGPPGGGPSRSSRSRREDLSAGRSGGAGAPSGGGGPHHPGDEAFVNSWGESGSSSRRGEGGVWGERGLLSSDASQQPQFGAAPPIPHRRGGADSPPPMRRRHMGAPEGAPAPDARYAGSFGELRGRTSEHQGGAAGGHLPRGGVGTAEERRGGSSSSSWSHRGSGLQEGALGPPPAQPFRSSGGPSRRDGASTLNISRGPHGGPQRDSAAFGQLSYRA